MNQTLLYEFIVIMERKKWNKTDLATKTGIHISDISRIFNEKKPLSLHNLDAITKAFDLPEGTFYLQYVQACFNQKHHLDKRRSVPYIYKCALHGYDKELSYMITEMLEESSKSVRTKNLNYLFSVAEQLFNEGFENESLPLYEIIIEHMPNRFSEEVAISYFRKFYMKRFNEKGQFSLAHVLEHIAYMPEKFQELSYLWITATYYMLKEWDEVLYYARRLEKMAKEEDHYGRALLYQSFAITRLGSSLEEVLALIDRYEKVNDYYADIAIGNRFVAYIEFQQFQFVDDYLNWLIDRDDLFVGLPRILETYVKLNRLTDASLLLKRFKDEIAEMSTSNELFKQQIYLDFCYSHALYQCADNRYTEGLNELLNVAEQANNKGIQEKYKQCLLSLWKYRNYLTPEHEQKYIELLSIKENRKIIGQP
ncbi:transcriptional regulator with XRE-family HTH domain [Bacillus pakistanensis]|uniref:Transcriptional regulator with XRE-family HTH domain n=1 Tax=Rossellomorea pakistanensis TaxID=992288 RepID=A0ABS2NHA1_9BACI|nr:helix-turn-helix transcriptional regulator [Bacillus pakistanensis]MBM7587217.1 transcriptional regulator with XRE-family HTH domain [Bacillus pakistanensis]